MLNKEYYSCVLKPEPVNGKFQTPGTIRFFLGGLQRETVEISNVELTEEGLQTLQVEIPPDARNRGPAAIHMPAELFEGLPFRYGRIVESLHRVCFRPDERR
jgi:hypothetical protein